MRFHLKFDKGISFGKKIREKWILHNEIGHRQVKIPELNDIISGIFGK